MSAANATPATPVVETLLRAAHGALDGLRLRRHTLLISGIDADNLPDDDQLMAFALLGDRGRNRLLEQMSDHWSALQERGLANGALADARGPELRLLAHALPHTSEVEPVMDLLRQIDAAPAPPRGSWHCARRVRGAWGQPAQVHFHSTGMRHLLFEPDPIFGQQPALLALDPERRQSGSVRFPIDRGRVRVTMRHRDGTVYRHEIETMIEEAA